MRKFLLLTLICALGFFGNLNAQETSFSYNFDNGSMEGWRVFQVSAQADGDNWAITPASDNGYYVGCQNTKCVFSISYNGTCFYPDNYIVTEKAYQITDESVLSWFIRHTYYMGYEYYDPYKVVISEDGETFTEIWSGYAAQGETEKEISLIEYAGQSLYIGFYHCYGGCGDGICLDNIVLAGGEEPFVPEEPKAYRLESIAKVNGPKYVYDEEFTNRVVEIEESGLKNYMEYNEVGQLTSYVSCHPYEDENGNPTDTISSIEYLYEGNVLVGYKESAIMGMSEMQTQEYELIYDADGKLLFVRSIEKEISFAYNSEGLLSEKDVAYTSGPGEDLSVEEKEAYTYENGKLVKITYYGFDWIGSGKTNSELYIMQEDEFEYDENGNCISKNVYTINVDEEGNEVRDVANTTEYFYDLTIPKDDVYRFEYPHELLLNPARPSYNNILIKEHLFYSFYEEIFQDTVKYHDVIVYNYNPEVLSAPLATVLTAAVLDGQDVTLYWNAYADAETFIIYQNEEIIAESVEGETYKVEDLEKGKEYCFSVKAVNSVGVSESSNVMCVTIKNEAIEELASSINIYPNPVENVLFIETTTAIEEVSVYNIIGVIVYDEERVMDNVELDVAEFNSGVYFVRVRTSEGETVKRFIKN